MGTNSCVRLTLIWMVAACAVGLQGRRESHSGRLDVDVADDDDEHLFGDTGDNDVNSANFFHDQHHPHFVINTDTDEILSSVTKRALQTKPKPPVPASVTLKSRPSWQPTSSLNELSVQTAYPDVVIGKAPHRLKGQGQGHQGHHHGSEARSRKRASLETLIARLTQMGGTKHSDNNRVSLVRFGPGRR